MVVLLKLCAFVLFVTIANGIPIIKPCQPEILAPPATIVGTTIVDNSVSNALANTLQLLIVSNLIDNTINVPGSCAPNILPAVKSLCDIFPLRACSYPLACDVIPECISSIPYNPIREPVEVIRNVYYPEILPIPPCCDIIPECACNIGHNCGFPNIPNPNILIPSLPNFGCGCKNIAFDPCPFICDKSAPVFSEKIFEVNCNPWGFC